MSRSRLAQHSGYLERLISMIQPRFYVSTDAADSATARRFQKHIAKPRAEEKHQHKITARERKRARLDPAQPTSLDKQREISASEATTRGDLVDGSEEDEGSDTGDAHIGGVGDDAKGGVLSGIAAPSASSVAELRERLAERLHHLRANRGGEARPRVGAHEHKAARKAALKAPKRAKPADSSVPDGATGAHAAPPTAAARTAATSGVSDASQMDFNQLTGAAGPSRGWKRKRKLGHAQLLAQAEEKARARRVRTAEGGEDAQIGVWERALEKASGIKQKDDPALLRKTMRQKERQRKKSAQDWKAREKTVADAKREKQDTRKSNLAARKTKNKSKRDRARPGFEGKKPSFFN